VNGKQAASVNRCTETTAGIPRRGLCDGASERDRVQSAERFPS